MFALFITHLTLAPLLESENFLVPSLVWLSEPVQCFRSRCISGAAVYLSVLQPHFASGAPGGFGVRNRAVPGNTGLWSHPNLRQLKHVSAYCNHGFNFLILPLVVKLAVSAMNFSWAAAQGVFPSQAAPWPFWLWHVWEPWQPLEELKAGNIIW